MGEDLELEEGGSLAPPTRVRHIKKRALKNKALTVSFNEKDLRDFVDGFHKRKKKRRKEAQKQVEEKLRRNRIEARKKRKLEEQFVIGACENGENEEDDGENQEDKNEQPDASVSGTTTYETNDLKVTVTTSEISREEEAKETLQPIGSRSVSRAPTTKPVPVKKTKSFKKTKKRKSRSKSNGKTDKKKRSKQKKKSR